MTGLDHLRAAIVGECGIDGTAIQPGMHLLKDFDFDSLDLLNATFRLDADTGVKLPLQQWLQAEYGPADGGTDLLTVDRVAAFIDQELAARG